MLRECGYTAHRTRYFIKASHGDVVDWDSDTFVLVERTDGMTEAEILESWKR